MSREKVERDKKYSTRETPNRIRYHKLKALINHLTRHRMRSERAAGEETIKALERDILKRRE